MSGAAASEVDGLTGQPCRASSDRMPRLPSPRPILAEDASLFMQLERAVEEEFRPQMLETLQRKVVEAVAGAESGSCPTCECNGRAMSDKGGRTVSWLCRFGRVHAKPKRYRCDACAKTHRPAIEALGVEPGRICGSLARLVALLGCVVPYELGSRLALMLLGVEVSTMSVWRCVQRLGEACLRYEEALNAHHLDSLGEPAQSASAPDTVVVGVDGCALGMQVRPKRRHFKRPEERLVPLPKVEEGHFREVKTGVLLLPEERFEPSPGRRSVLRRVLVSCLGNADGIFSALWARMQELSWLGPKTMVVVVADGAHWIWNRAAEAFPLRCEILDFWHAVERAWEFGRLHFGQGSKQGDRWAHRLSRDLRDGKVEQVIKRLRRMRPRTHEAQEKLDTLIGYYESNKARMHYDEYIRLGYGIGSGAVESAHKQLVHARLRQAGMRWSEVGARRLLALRVMLLNGDWDELDRLRMVSLAA